MQNYTKIYSARYSEIFLKVIPGHFVTPNSHINYYIDMTTMKTRLSEARNVARALSEGYAQSTIVDTIICMDGTEVIGAYLAEELERQGIPSQNAHQTIYVVTPEYDLSGQMIFRENSLMMVRGKHVLILLASLTTGTTLLRAIESVNYYGGTVSGVSAIFSAARKVADIPVQSVFSTADLPQYHSYKAHDCEMCRKGIKIDAIANGFGYSRL